jgi:hypothetical protein
MLEIAESCGESLTCFQSRPPGLTTPTAIRSLTGRFANRALNRSTLSLRCHFSPDDVARFFFICVSISTVPNNRIGHRSLAARLSIRERVTFRRRFVLGEFDGILIGGYSCGMTAYACTLFEGNYHLGLGALFNSLYRNGFRGTLFAGYRGELPPWAAPVSAKDGVTDFAVADGGKIRFIRLDTSRHLASYKPIFMQEVFEKFLRDDDILCYFDPDITIKCRWNFFEQWVQNGLALVEDCTFPYLPSDHPLRYQWLDVARSAGLTPKRSPSRYYNSGFVGVPGRFRDVLAVWESLLDVATKAFGYDPKRLASADRTSPWQASDQDVLNIVVMTIDAPLSTLGPDGMDFRPGGYVMAHAVNAPKPWARDYLKFALMGKPPNLSDKGFWENVVYPLRLFPEFVVRKRSLLLKAAIAMGRLWHRP